MGVAHYGGAAAQKYCISSVLRWVASRIPGAGVLGAW